MAVDSEMNVVAGIGQAIDAVRIGMAGVIGRTRILGEDFAKGGQLGLGEFGGQLRGDFHLEQYLLMGSDKPLRRRAGRV